MTYGELLRREISALEDTGADDARFDCTELLKEASGLSSGQLLMKNGETVGAEVIAAFTEMTAKRKNGEPLQYIIGKWEFLGNEFFVGDGVLIPRPETEQLAEMCIRTVKDNGIKVVYDLCAGSGCIGISIAKACPDVNVFLFEKYEKAAFYCKKNMEKHRVDNARLCIKDIFDGMPDDLPECGLLVSNPPYIPSGEINFLQKEVLCEPRTALDGGKDGLDFYKAILSGWIKKNRSIKYCFVECGEEQAQKISEMLGSVGHTRIMDDLYGVPRFVICNC